MNLGKQVLFFMIIFGFFGLLLEGGIRLFSAIWYPKMMILDQQLGWRHAPNISKVFTAEDGTKALVVQNKYGHRGLEHGDKKSDGKVRILFLGDSFTEGSQVNEEELFTAILERANSNWEIINAGVGGYGTVQEYLYLINEGLKFKPDLVVLMVYQNDFVDNCLSYSPSMGPRPYAEWKNSGLHIVEELDWKSFRRFSLPVPFQDFLHTSSYVYYFLNTRIYQVVRGTTLGEIAKQDLRQTDGCAQYNILVDLVRKIRIKLRGVGSDLVLVAIPASEDIVAGTSQSSSQVLQLCVQENLQCLSLLDVFVQSVKKGEKAYFAVDIHWTKMGHQVVARAIEPFINSVLAYPTRPEVSPASRTFHRE